MAGAPSLLSVNRQRFLAALTAGALAAVIARAAFAAGAVAARATRTARPAARVAVLAAACAGLLVDLALADEVTAFLVARRFAGAFPAPRVELARGARVVDAVARLGADVLATAAAPPRDC